MDPVYIIYWIGLRGAGQPKTPEEIMHEQETSVQFWNAVDQVENTDQLLYQKIFDAILNLHHYKDQSQMIKFISQDTGIAESEVLTLMNKLKQKMERPDC